MVLWARPAKADLPSLLISLQSRTFACSPPLSTRTRLSICFVVRPHFARLPLTSNWLNAEIHPRFPGYIFVILWHFLLKVTDLQIVSQNHMSGQRWDQPQNTFLKRCFSNPVCPGKYDLLPALNRKSSAVRTAALHIRSPSLWLSPRTCLAFWLS